MIKWPWEKDEPESGKQTTREHALTKLQDLWPYILLGKTTRPGHAWFGDIDIWIPELGDVAQLLDATNVETYEYIKGIRDCDDFAAMLSHEVRIARHKAKALPWAFFECWVTKLDGKDTCHGVNLVLTMQGLYFIEPQRDTLRKASSFDDRPYFLKT